MFDTHSDYALNKLDTEAIIFSSVSGEHIRLTREDFSSEEEFVRWKAWSDDDYRSTEVKAQNDARCLPLDIQRDVPSLSAENAFFQRISMDEKAVQRADMMKQIKSLLTEVQLRRLYLFCVKGFSVEKIAATEGVTKQAIYLSLDRARRKVVNNL